MELESLNPQISSLILKYFEKNANTNLESSPVLPFYTEEEIEQLNLQIQRKRQQKSYQKLNKTSSLEKKMKREEQYIQKLRQSISQTLKNNGVIILIDTSFSNNKVLNKMKLEFRKQIKPCPDLFLGKKVFFLFL